MCFKIVLGYLNVSTFPVLLKLFSVPLEHYLYTGSNGKTRDERFLVLDANGRFVEQGYKKAIQVQDTLSVV